MKSKINTATENGSKGTEKLKEEKQYWKTTFFAMIQPVMLLLFLAATIRQAGSNIFDAYRRFSFAMII